jgi:hypothetical protein
LALELLESALELRIGPTKVFDLEFHRSIFSIEVIDKIFEGSIPLSHLLNIHLGNCALTTT